MFLIATAGHIDHGKTALVHALTGVETDRLAQEKARGISIDLGFAYWTDHPDRIIGFVDVPGHERFVATMLAGAGAVDFALIVVAADDGIMPQTREHLDILDLLGVRRGVVALTKADLVDAERLASLGAEISALLAGTPLAGSPVHAVSARDGMGIDQLARELRRGADETRADRRTGLGFRLAIDKAFSIPGAGTVVSGAIREGEVAVGDELVLAPSGLAVRVRGLQDAGRSVGRAVAGDRCALNLRGLALDQVHRGDWLLAPGHCRPSQRLAVDLRALPGGKGILHDSQLHLHLGTADMPCRVVLSRQKRIEAGESAVAHLVPARPVSAIAGEAFVLRDAAARQTVGGGQIVDPLAPRRSRRDTRPDLLWQALRDPDPERGFHALLAHQGVEVDARAYGLRRNLTAERVEAMLSRTGILRCGPAGQIALSAETAAIAGQAMLEGVTRFHAAHPDLAGRPLAAALADLPFSLTRDARRGILRELKDSGALALRGGFVHRPGHLPQRPKSSAEQWQRLLAAAELFGDASFGPRDLADAIRLPEDAVTDQLFEHRGQMRLWRISPTRFMQDCALRGIAAEALALTPARKSGFDVASLRDCTGLGRNLLIEVLEFFDRTGITQRRGDRRRVVPDLDAAFQRAAHAEATLPRRSFIKPSRPARRQPR